MKSLEMIEDSLGLLLNKIYKFTDEIKLYKQQKIKLAARRMEYPKVSVLILSYNAKEYLEQCIKCVLDQKAEFNFSILIADDASTDGSQDTIRRYTEKYPKKITSLLREKNLGLIRNYCDAVEEMSGEYYAVCSGDDFWHDPYKLKRQVEYLDMHPEVAMVHTDWNVLDVRTGELIKGYRLGKGVPVPSGNVFQALLKKNFISACSVCLRLDVLKESVRLAQFERNNWEVEDYPVWLVVAARHQIVFLDTSTYTYRDREGSVSKHIKKQGRAACRMKNWQLRRWACQKFGILFPDWLAWYDIPFAYFCAKKQWKELRALFQNPDFKLQRTRYKIKAKILKQFLKATAKTRK